MKGYLTTGDGRNLGLHEMAHALKIANAVPTKESDFLEPSIIRQFVMLAREEMYLIESGEDTFFRPYAASNEDEFFAVAVENFFDKPGPFSAQKNKMFNVLVQLLNQKP